MKDYVLLQAVFIAAVQCNDISCPAVADICAGSTLPPDWTHPEPTGIMYGDVLAWEGSGVWVLEMTDELAEVYEQLPPTFDVSITVSNDTLQAVLT
jgi:hypothetical protein